MTSENLLIRDTRTAMSVRQGMECVDGAPWMITGADCAILGR